MIRIEMTEQVSNQLLIDALGDAGTYSGDVLGGLAHGNGVMDYETGRQYSGSWYHSLWQGKGGRMTLPNGDMYEGDFHQHERQGHGVYTWVDGRRYNGEFQNDQRHGDGTFTWTDGASYVGEFHQGQRHGRGQYHFPLNNDLSTGRDAGGGSYQGDFHHGKYQGYGVCVWPDGRVYRGEWNEGMAHGRGVELDAQGIVVHDGDWQLDQPVLTTTAGQPTMEHNQQHPKQQLRLGLQKQPQQHTLLPVVNREVCDARGRPGIFRGMLLQEIPHGVGHMTYHKSEEVYQGFWDMGHWQGEGQMELKNGDVYQGEFQANQRHGTGTYRWNDGRQYTGQWDHDKRHGKGQFLYPTGDSFEGYFHQGLRSGKGRFEFYDGGFYEGFFKDGEFHGTGCKLVHKDGRVYFGEFADGKMNGFGKEVYPNGDLRYEGEWIDDAPVNAQKIQPPPPGFIMQQQIPDEENDHMTVSITEKGRHDDPLDTNACQAVVELSLTDAQGNPGTYTGLAFEGMPHGVGRIVYNNSNIREGFWKYGYLEGYARAFFANGDFYEGNFIQSQREGKGVYKWSDGRIYEGGYVNDLRHGLGRFVYPSGDVFVGDYKTSQRSGMGRFTFHDGSFYDGAWHDSVYQGYGELIEQDGSSYKGEWKKGVKAGKGTMFDRHGRAIRHGEWQDDELVHEQELEKEDTPSEPIKESIDYGLLEGEYNDRWSKADYETKATMTSDNVTESITLTPFEAKLDKVEVLVDKECIQMEELDIEA